MAVPFRFSRLRLPSLALVSALAASPSHASAPDPERVLATVGDDTVTVASLRAELDAKYEESKGTFDASDPVERRAAITRLIDRRLFSLGALDEIAGAEAVADSIRRHEEIRATWLSLKRGLHPGPDALTPEAIETFREQRAAAWFGRQILVTTPTEVQEVQRRLDAGEAFEDLAKELSYDAGSAAIGGLLFPLRYGDWYPELIDLAFGLAPGAHGGPVQSRNGYHIMRCDSIIYTPEDPEVFTPYELRLRILRKAEFDGIDRVVDEYATRFGVEVSPEAVDVVTDNLAAVGNPTLPLRPAAGWTPPADLPIATSAEGDTMFVPEFIAEMDVLKGYDWPTVGNPTSVKTAAERLMIAAMLRREMHEGTFDPGPVARAEVDAVVQRHLGNMYFRQVLEPGPVDSARAEEIFADHPEAFAVPAMASVAILGVSSEAMADSVETWLAAGMSVPAAGARAKTMDDGAFYNRPTPLFPKGTFPDTDDLVFSQLDVGGVSARMRTSTGYQWYHLARREPPRPASRLELTTELLTGRSRAYLLDRNRRAHLEELRRRYPVSIDEQAVGEVVQYAD